jgi:hypothetical protein
MGGRRCKQIIPEEIKPTNLIKTITYDLLIQKFSIKKKVYLSSLMMKVPDHVRVLG